MVNIYDSLRNENGDLINGRTKLFIINIQDDGTVGEYISGIACVPEGNGTMFIVDDYVVEQIDKLMFIGGELKVKDGETIEEPIKSEVEIQEEELLRQLAELRAKKDRGE